uniref:DNA topoisomerase (ATP-hydrolyzing) n=1 Tax=Lingulaulax polyedra TaxID=160621 RepID=A0A516AG58_LINPO|nr:meiotic recombination protein SPO11 [Lingulodinium polyedra]
MAAAEPVPLPCRAQPWGPEARRLELLAAVEAAVLALLRAAAAPGPWPPAAAPAAGGAPGRPKPALAVPVRGCAASVALAGLVPTAPASAAERLAAKLQLLLDGGKAGPTERKALRLRRLLALLDSVHGLLCSGRHATPRELFYTHATLFDRQQQSDDLLKILCRTLEVPRHYLRLVGTAKGLVRGHLRILEPSLAHGAPSATGDGGSSVGVWVDGLDPLEPGGHSISPACAHLVRVESMARTVLLVEKETVFHRLLEEGVLERHRPCVLITARGFPDAPSRYFLRRLWEDLACPRVLALADFDAAGLAIGATYAFGPEEPWTQDDLAVPAASPLVCPGGAAGAARFGLQSGDAVALTARDRALAQGLLRRLARLREAPSASAWENAAALLLEGGVKYELDALDRLSDFVDFCLRSPGD